MGVIRLLELLSGLVVAVLGVAKAYIEYRMAKLKHRAETNESGDADQANPRS